MTKNISKICLNLCLAVSVMFAFLGIMLCALDKSFVTANVEKSFEYKAQLSEKQVKYYNLIKDSAEKQLFREGNKSVDLIENNVVTKEEVANYAKGDSTILTDFGSARDAFMLDYPQYFYIDYDKLTLNIAQKGDEYVAEIGAGRDSNYYIASGLDNQKVTQMEVDLQQKIQAMQGDINLYQSNFEGTEKTKEIINRTIYLISPTSGLSFALMYDFCENDPQNAPYIRTAYSLVTGNAVCQGYVKVFKMLMDYYQIPCIEVDGYYLHYDLAQDRNLSEPHAWTYCKVGDDWYLVDPTYMTSGTAFALLGSNSTANYIASKSVSNSGKEFDLPVLAVFDYGTTEIQTKILGDFDSVEVDYSNPNSTDACYLVANTGIVKNGEFTWYGYFGTDSSFTTTTDWTIGLTENVQLYQFFVTTQKPTNTDSGQAIWDSLDTNKVIAKSNIVVNDNYNEAEAEKPLISAISPSNSVYQNANKKHEIVVTYSKNLKTTGTPNVKVFSSSYEDMTEYVKVQNVTILDNQLKFMFTPSKMYKHFSMQYIFEPQNMLTVDDYEVTNFTMSFAMPSTVCNKVFNNGRLYIDSFATPTLVDNQDLSLEGWLVNGEAISQNQRSQMALVVSTVDDKDSNDMEASVEDNVNIKKSSTYELDLNICGAVVQIPSGSYVKVAFGYPEGFSFDSKNTTYKLYHFKRDSNGNIDRSSAEEIKITMTEYGIVAILNSFSPFMLVATDSDENSAKSVYIRNINNGGNFVSTINETSQDAVAYVQENETLQIAINADTDYQIDYCLVNKKAVAVVDGKISLSYAELDENNTVEIAYVAKSVADFESANNIQNLNNTFSQNTSSQGFSPATAKDRTWFYVGLAVIIVDVIAIVALVIYARKKRAKQAQETK